MTEDARATTILLVGALLVRLSLGGAYTRFVRAGMGSLLLAAGVLLVLLGLVGVVRALVRTGDAASGAARDGRPAAPHDHGAAPAEDGDDGPALGDGRGLTHVDGHGDAHGHAHGGRVGWLLLAPVLALFLVTPPALGSFGVGRSAAVDVSSGGKTFDPLPAGRTVPMSLLEFDQRAADHGGAGFGTTPVRLTGFVMPPDGDRGFRIARYQIACCAADAIASVVRVTGTTGTPPARDRWVTVTGTFRRSAGGVPELVATSLAEVPGPADPYE